MILRSLHCAVVAATFLAAVASEARPAVIFDGVAAGDVTSTDAILWARADDGGNTTRLTAQIATDPGFTNIVSALDGTTTAASDFTLKLDATGLTSNTRYYFHFVTPDGIASPTGQFTTAPMPSEKVDVRFGFSGDADGRFRPYLSIANIASQKLNYFIFLGDTMYETPDAGSLAVPTITGETTDPASLSRALAAYNQKYLNNVLGVNAANGQPALTGQQSLQPMLAATGTCNRAARRSRRRKARQTRPLMSTRLAATTIRPWPSKRSKNHISITTRRAPQSLARPQPVTSWPDRRSQHLPTRAATAPRGSIFRSNGAPTASISRSMIAATATSAFPGSEATGQPTIWARGRTMPIGRCSARRSSNG